MLEINGENEMNNGNQRWKWIKIIKNDKNNGNKRWKWIKIFINLWKHKKMMEINGENEMKMYNY